MARLGRLALLLLLVTGWLAMAAPGRVEGEVEEAAASQDVALQVAPLPPVHVARHEELLIQGLEALQGNRLDEALAEFATLTREKPDFRLAQIIYGDLLMARAAPIKGFGNGQVINDALLADLLDEARTRVRYLAERPAPGMIPQQLLLPPSHQQNAVVVDLSKSRLYIFRTSPTDPPVLLADYYISSGKNGPDKLTEGDKRTPLGLYFVTERLMREQLPGTFYGAGALPLNYPNQWDQVVKRTGTGIWLHGTPVNTYSRPPRASDGCVALTNQDFIQLLGLSDIGTPVIIGESLTWVSPQEWREQRELFLGMLETWRLDWNSGDPAQLLAHYSPDFRNLRVDLAGWQSETQDLLKHSVAGRSELKEVSILGHPAAQPMIVVSFVQHLTDGDGHSLEKNRLQYWRLEGKGWKIVYEEATDPAPYSQVSQGSRGNSG